MYLTDRGVVHLKERERTSTPGVERERERQTDRQKRLVHLTRGGGGGSCTPGMERQRASTPDLRRKSIPDTHKED